MAVSKSTYWKCTIAGMLFCAAVISANGQLDTTLILKQIEVTAQRIDFTAIGKHSDALDTNTMDQLRHSTLANMLSDQTPLYLRSYGNGTLTTLGIRGGSSSHTQIVWNGIPIRNPMIGLVDLALMPSWFFDQAAIHYGGHGSAFGSGAVGGLISIGNQPLTGNESMTIQLSAGSWDQRSGEIKLNYGIKRLKFSTRAFSKFAENNYRYIPYEGADEKFQTNHRLKDNGLLQEITYDLNEKQNLTARLWYQHTDRQIPPTSVQTFSKSAQKDEDVRSSLQWSYRGDKFKWELKAAWLDEKIDYRDSLIQLYTHNRFKTFLTEAQTAFNLHPDINVAAGIYFETVEASADNYDVAKNRAQYAAFTTARWIKNDWLIRLQGRQELTAEDWSPFLIDLSTEWSGLDQCILKASVSRNYRTPTLNDIYWRPGGNPNLLPEKGWTFEGGIHYKSPLPNSNFTTSLTAYTRKIDQWIMWMPPVKDVRNYWSPINISEVNSHGIEFRSGYDLQSADWKINMSAGADFTWSTFGTPIPDFNIEAGEQLFYVPVENISSQVRIILHSWSAFYHHHWYGASPGINERVEAGNIGSAGIGYTFQHESFHADMLLQSDNIWNVPYRLIERRPMPGRSFELGLRISI